jgi:hypothetical protein
MGRWLATCTGCFIVGLAVVAQSGEVEREQKKIERTNETSLRTTVDFGAGSITMAACPPELIVDAQAVYDKKQVDFFVDYRVRGERGALDLSSDLYGKSMEGKVRNEWQLDLASGVPQDLNMKVGAAEAKLNLSGLQLTALKLDIGAADAEIWWDEPNQTELTDLAIDCGASSLKLSGLGYANVENLEFEGGLGSFEIDCRGPWTRSAQADFEMGLGSLELTIPEDLATRIEVEKSFMSSVDIDGHFEEVDDDVYETRGYDQAKVRLDVRLKLGLGSVDVRSARP